MAIETKEQWQARRDAAVTRGRRFSPHELSDDMSYNPGEQGVQEYARAMVPDWVGPKTTAVEDTPTTTSVVGSEGENAAENIRQAMQNINNLFGGRQGVYDRLKSSSYALSERAIADSYEDALRELNFRMHGQGLDTGQVNIDLLTGLEEQKADSLTDAMIAAGNLSGRLRSADESKREKLLQLAASGSLMPGRVGDAAGAFEAGVPQAWQGIGDIPWKVPTGFMPHAFESMAAPKWGNPYYVKGTSGVVS